MAQLDAACHAPCVEMPSHLGDQIKRWRVDAELGQEDLANLVGVRMVTISRWERGIHKPSPRNVEAIRRATGNAVSAPETAQRAPIYYLAERVAALEAKIVALELRLAAVEPATSLPEGAEDLAAHQQKVAPVVEKAVRPVRARRAREGPPSSAPPEQAQPRIRRSTG